MHMAATLRCASFLPTLALVIGLLLPATAADRPSAVALGLPDNALMIDGRDDDWQRAGALQAQQVANDQKNILISYIERGGYAGSSDISFTAWMVTDSAYLYVLADVRDQLLINDATITDAYNGDDFEVFIDASPLENRYAKSKGENYRQLIFVPKHVNLTTAEVMIWQAEKVPGVKAASRLRPWGYTIEIAIPKALFPNWQANPQMNSIGFDLTVNDADAPGVEISHPALKSTMCLLSPAPHFQSPAQMGALLMTGQAAPVDAVAVPAPALSTEQLITQLSTATTANAEALAQQVLDVIESQDTEQIASAALATKFQSIRKAGLVIFAKRPELNMPMEPLLTVVKGLPDTYGRTSDSEMRSYALMALALRNKLPAKELFGGYARSADPSLRLTFIWSLGVNGDTSIVPELTKLLFDGNMRVRSLAAMALGRLGDPSSLPAMQEMVANDPHHYSRDQAKLAISTIEAAQQGK